MIDAFVKWLAVTRQYNLRVDIRPNRDQIAYQVRIFSLLDLEDTQHILRAAKRVGWRCQYRGGGRNDDDQNGLIFFKIVRTAGE